MLCEYHCGREKPGMNKWEKPQLHFILLHEGGGKLPIIKYRSTFCWNVPTVHLVTTCSTSALDLSLLLLGSYDSQKGKNVELIEEKCDSLGRAQLTGECLPMRKYQILKCSSRESHTCVGCMAHTYLQPWSVVSCFQELTFPKR